MARVVITSKRPGSMMFVAALILWSSISVHANSSPIGPNIRFDIRKGLICLALCAISPAKPICILNCLNGTIGKSSAGGSGSLTYTALDHCGVGCFLSTCLDHHSDTKKAGVDEKKVTACADSCSQGCQKTYSLQ
ncbi:hypothetical protein ACJRO7_001637 [Eucalyptus globulus]|uniref:Uncharacterized protein n=1 Tax=Eucalyptus globulus TaxID=34317 RepID=A0ABD3LWT7_EUCGL